MNCSVESQTAELRARDSCNVGDRALSSITKKLAHPLILEVVPGTAAQGDLAPLRAQLGILEIAGNKK